MKTMMKTTIAMMAISISGCATPSAKAQDFKGRVIEFTSGPEGFDTRTFFYEGAHEVIAFDSQFTPALAQASIAHLRTFTDKPISWLVITHPNPDKFNGASVFKAAGTKIISSEAISLAISGVHAYKEYFFVEMAKMFKPGQYPQPVAVDEVFKGETRLTLRGGEHIQLKELSQPGISATQTVAFIPSVKALMVGDLIHYKAHAWLEGGIVDGKPTPTISGWISDLKELGQTYSGDTQVFGGRGKTVDLKTGAKEQIEYLRKAQSLVRDYAKNHDSANVDYKELSQIFAKNFPSYQLSYMIEYGAYGLMQSELAKK